MTDQARIAPDMSAEQFAILDNARRTAGLEVRIGQFEKMNDRPARIMAKLMSRVRHEGECWLWTGPTSGGGRGGGYGRMSLDGQTVATHRVMATLIFGYIPGNKQVDHTCGNRLCLNPDHLEIVTHKENQRRRDRAQKAGCCD